MIMNLALYEVNLCPPVLLVRRELVRRIFIEQSNTSERKCAWRVTAGGDAIPEGEKEKRIKGSCGNGDALKEAVKDCHHVSIEEALLGCITESMETATKRPGKLPELLTGNTTGQVYGEGCRCVHGVG